MHHILKIMHIGLQPLLPLLLYFLSAGAARTGLTFMLTMQMLNALNVNADLRSNVHKYNDKNIKSFLFRLKFEKNCQQQQQHQANNK